MNRLENLGTEYTLARAVVKVSPTGRGWQRWSLVTRYGEPLGKSGIEPSKSKAQAAGGKAAREYNAKLTAGRGEYRRKNVKRGCKNKIGFETGIA